MISKASKNFGVIEASGVYDDDLRLLQEAGLAKRVRPTLKRYKLTLKGWKLARKLGDRIPYGA